MHSDLLHYKCNTPLGVYNITAVDENVSKILLLITPGKYTFSRVKVPHVKAKLSPVLR